MAKGPVLIDLSETPSVADAPPVPDTLAEPLPQGRAMQAAARMAARRPSLLARMFWWVTTTLIGAVVSIAAWDFANGLIARAPVLGWIVTALFALFVAILLLMAVRELAALARLTRIDDLRHQAATAIEAADLPAARKVTDRLVTLYSSREDTRWGRERLQELRGDQMDAAALLTLADAELLAPLDVAASREVDVATALTANLRMIRRVADVYGGRSGFFGSWQLTRAVLSHLVATGAVAVGDDMLEPVLGGSLLGKLSRRFGEGLVNGALTARVGVAAMDVCRPLPFPAGKRPTSRGIVQRSLTGLFGSKER